jgi:hypothetical protein
MTTNVLKSRPSAKRSDKRPDAQPLFERLEKSLVKYAVDATAAGVGLLALATPASADTISHSVRINLPLHHPAGVFGSDAQGTNWFSSHIKFRTSITSMGLSHWRGKGFLDGVNASIMIVQGECCSIWGPLKKGTPIGGPGGFFVPQVEVSVFGCSFSLGGREYCFSSRGGWTNATGYMGAVIDINGHAHYGWAQLYDGTELISQAYNPVANQPILAGETTSIPEPATLGLLALGCFGLGLWRKRQAARRS